MRRIHTLIMVRITPTVAKAALAGVPSTASFRTFRASMVAFNEETATSGRFGCWYFGRMVEVASINGVARRLCRKARSAMGDRVTGPLTRHRAQSEQRRRSAWNFMAGFRMVRVAAIEQLEVDFNGVLLNTRTKHVHPFQPTSD